MEDFYKKLKEYFDNTPKDIVFKDWGITKKDDDVGISVDEFLKDNEISKPKSPESTKN